MTAHIDNKWITALLVLLAGLFVSVPASASFITASVDRNPVSIDESFTLRLTARGGVDGDPDLGPLRKDFDILGTSQSTSMNFVNGNFSRESTWNITLISKSAGVHTIPSISFGKEQSPAIRITVNDTPASHSKASGRELFMEVETDTERTWVQGQVIYTVRLFRNVDINNASLSPPRTSDPDAIIEKLGDDITYEAFRDGVRYDVIERRFAIFPQHSGKLTIEPTLFEGRIGIQRSLFDTMVNDSKIKRVRSDAIEVDIEAVPAGMDAASWLPAESVSLVEEWSTPTDELRAGEPVTRTITINARGVLSNQISEPAFADIDGIKQYPDQPQGNNRTSKQGIEAVKQVKLAMIPGAGGRIMLPEVELPWWNTRTGEAEIARLPSRELVIAGEAATSAAADARPQAEAVVPAAGPEVTVPATTTDDVTATPWPWISLGLAIAWLITLALLLRGRGPSQSNGPSLRQLRKTLLQDCETSDAEACKRSLLAWARARWPMQRIHNLMDIVPLLDKSAADSVRELNSLLYSGHASNWNGAELARHVRALPLQYVPETIDTDPIEPLFKT